MSKKEISIKEIAELTGYSIATVSRVVNNRKGKYSEKTRDKILKVIQDTNYEPNTIAKSLRVSRTNTIGVIVPDLSNAFFARLVQEIESQLFESGYTLVICTTNKIPEKEEKYLKMLGGKRVDGVIIISGEGEFIQDSYFKNVPIICIDRETATMDNVACVHSNHIEAGETAVKKLLSDGCEKVAFVTQDSELLMNRMLLKGFKSELSKNNIPDKNIIEVFSDDRFSKTGAAKAVVTDLLECDKFDYDAAFCSDDRTAVGVILALEKKGILVPDNFEVIGYGNDPISKYLTPNLTSIKQNRFDIAAVAIQELLNKLSTDKTGYRDKSIPVELILRKTTK